MAAKYLFRNGKVTRAQEVAQLFTRDSDQAGNDLFDMQVMWYEIESAQAHFKAGKIAMVWAPSFAKLTDACAAMRSVRVGRHLHLLEHSSLACVTWP